MAAADRACDVRGWLGWDARRDAEQQLREALGGVTQLRASKRTR